MTVVEEVDLCFIVYDARSGSTYLGNVLDKHPALVVPPETNFIGTILHHWRRDSIESESELSTVNEILRRDDKFADWQVDIEDFRRRISRRLPVSLSQYFTALFSSYAKRLDSRPSCICIKKDTNLFAFQRIKRVFPNSKFINIVRDGRAVFASKKSALHSRTRKPFETNPVRAALDWVEVNEWFIALCKSFPEDSILVYYEEFLENTESEIGNILDFLGLERMHIDWRRLHDSDSKLVTDRYIKTGIHRNVQKRPQLDRINAWKKNLSFSEVALYEAVAGKYLMRHNYDPSLHCKLLTSIPVVFVRRLLKWLRGVKRGSNTRVLGGWE